MPKCKIFIFNYLVKFIRYSQSYHVRVFTLWYLTWRHFQKTFIQRKPGKDCKTYSVSRFFHKQYY